MSNTAETLDAYLAEEISLYKQYLKLLQEERQAVRSSKTEEILLLSAKRDELVSAMRECNERRFFFLKDISKDRHITLSKFLASHLDKADRSRLELKRKELRQLVERSRSQSSELGQVVSFALKMASGLVSIIWSATQTVVQSYTSRGSIKESYHTRGSREGNTLKRA